MTTASVRPGARRENLSIDRMALWGSGLAVAGLLIAAVSLHLRSFGSSPIPVVLLDLAVLVGMTLFAMGVLGIFLGTKIWRSYIEAGLREVAEVVVTGKPPSPACGGYSLLKEGEKNCTYLYYGFFLLFKRRWPGEAGTEELKN